MGSKIITGINDLLSQRPDLAAEWHPTKNGDLTPQNVAVYSARSVWWQIEEVRYGKVFSLEWEAKISNRVNGSGCPYTSKPPKKLLKGFNDLLTTNPELAQKWHPLKNDGSPGERMNGRGCAICAGKVIIKGINDLSATHKELLGEWDYGRNQMKPETISYGYDKKVWWKHTVEREGTIFTHSWDASPNSRTNRKSGCPYCENKKVMKGFNDLETLLPEIAGKWDPVRNMPLKPCDVTIGSRKQVYWIDRTRPIRICDRTKYKR